MSTNEINFAGKVTIISGFPCIGKTTFCEAVKFDPVYVVHDIDSGDFKGYMRDRNAKLTQDEVDQAYVAHIKERYYHFKYKQSTDEFRDQRAYIIFVSAHEKIRKLMSEAELEFFYICPDVNHLPNIIEAAKIRLGTEEDDFARVPMKAAVKFLESDAAKASLEKTEADGDSEIYGQTWTVMLPFDSTGENPYMLSEFIHEYTKRDEAYDADHPMSKQACRKWVNVLLKLESDAYTSYEMFYHNNSHRTPIGKLHIDEEGYSKSLRLLDKDEINDAVNRQLGIDQFGRLVMIWDLDNEDTADLLSRKIDKSGLPPEIIDRLANFGLDSVVIDKVDIDEIEEALKMMRALVRQDDVTSEEFLEFAANYCEKGLAVIDAAKHGPITINEHPLSEFLEMANEYADDDDEDDED